jgi:hypothetical protein
MQCGRSPHSERPRRRKAKAKAKVLTTTSIAVSSIPKLAAQSGVSPRKLTETILAAGGVITGDRIVFDARLLGRQGDA